MNDFNVILNASTKTNCFLVTEIDTEIQNNAVCDFIYEKNRCSAKLKMLT